MKRQKNNPMPTFRFRLRFNIAQKGIISGDDEQYEFNLPNGKAASLLGVGAKKFSEAKSFVILSGGYSTEQDALNYGFKLKDAVLFYGTIFRVGVDVGKDKASSFLSKYMKDKIFDEHGLVMIDDVHGVTAYSEEHPTSCSSISATGLVNVRDAGFLTEKLCGLVKDGYTLSDQVKLAMELMTASFFESSSRARFLTLVLAAESILTPEYRSSEVQSVVDDLKARTKSSNLKEQDKSSILGTLNWLYKDSISQSLKKMAQSHLHDRTYGGFPSDKFIQKCYEARSKLVHSGAVNESKHNIGTLAANLEVYMKDMLTKLASL
ncbi:hypothetical protein [Vreelandella glaciei]|uniref:hypothetical protein n=1 Tax=Vreelandella glaciei TaxID=186761 RepID=UPI0030ED97B2